MSIRRKSLKSFYVLVLALILSLSSGALSFAAETKYKNWESVAAAMEETLLKGYEIYEAGGENAAKEATAQVNEAYFKFYEKLGFEKTVMSYISGKRGSSVENQFYLVKKAMKEGKSPEEVKEAFDLLITMLKEDAAILDGVGKNSGESKAQESSAEGESQPAKESNQQAPADNTANNAVMGFSTFIAVLGLTLREGLEAILVIAAIIAYLVKTDNKKYIKSVYIGAGLGILFSIALAGLFNYIAASLGDAQSGVGQEIFEGIAMFVAVVVLFYVSNWMLSKAETEVWDKYIKTKVEASITKGNMYALSFTAFLAVSREGAELILFFQGMRSNIANSPYHMWLGLGVAVVILAAIYFAIAKLSMRIPLKPFFVATSWLMFVLCVSFVGKGVFELQEAGVIGRTIIPAMNGFSFTLLGIYDRVETILPQLLMLIISTISFIMHQQNSKKKLAMLQNQKEEA
ncbi:MAG: FTR1 family protein [Johnsonella sp.]|nr:FTR1 family protein [Johnsonella sp.]